jgi:hypothetical protein
MAKNTNLIKAGTAKSDEFYTQLSDIENELRHYKEHFAGKTVLCNCDDPYESNFFKYFALNFHHLGLKKLITTSYVPSPIAGTQLSLFDVEGLADDSDKQPFRIEITDIPDYNMDGAVDLFDVTELLKSDENVVEFLPCDGTYPPGDFRSETCVELLRQADIVVTNPPFSLFREYVAQLVSHRKQFLIIGNVNAITYKETFPLIKEGELWLGASHRNKGLGMFFQPSEDYDMSAATRVKDGLVFIGGALWYTNLDYKSRHEEVTLWKNYTPEEFPSYDNYDAIEVARSKQIPMDYDGVMGVPITFLNSGYNPDQFEIVGMAKRGAGDPRLKSKVYTKEDYPNYSDLNAGPVVIENGMPRNTYPRILIRRKDNS